MLAIQSDIAKDRCLYSLGAVAFQTPGFFFYSPGRENAKVTISSVRFSTLELWNLYDPIFFTGMDKDLPYALHFFSSLEFQKIPKQKCLSP